MLEARSDIQVLITDVEMPGALNGFALARLVHRSWPRIGIVVVSGRQAPAPGELPHSAVYLLKPYTPDKLVGAVRSVLPREAEPIVVEPERVEVPVLPISAVLSSRPGAEGVSGGLAQPLPEPPDE
jgi:DNA-binding NarL/FixJ family response regulator